MSRRADVEPVFVNADTAAKLCQVSRDTFDSWVRSGFVPPPSIDRGQIMRWHWPSLEQRLAGHMETVERDPFMEGLNNVRPHQKDRRSAAA